MLSSTMSNTWSLVTYNIFDGAHERVELIRAVLAACHADVILLNEADDANIVATLAHALGMNHIWARGSGDKHIALLARGEIRDWQIHNQRPITQALLEARVVLPSSVSIKLYGVHLLPYFMLLPYEVARWRTVNAILHVIRSRPREPHILLGDFNAITRGEAYALDLFPARVRRRMWWQAQRAFFFALAPIRRAGYIDSYRAIHPHAPGQTWTPDHPSARLDYIFLDPEFAQNLVACNVFTSAPARLASDHYPLVAKFKI